MKWYDAEQSAQEDIIGNSGSSTSPYVHPNDKESIFAGGRKKKFDDFKM
jgi:hypothetical protein